MVWNLAITALATIFILSALLSVLSLKRKDNAKPLEGYLLAGSTLNRSSVVSLLLSSSFGLNALFYAVWLGYTVGAWAILIQSAWALSFVLLAPHSSKIHKHRSLHDLLGDRFGWPTRVIAGICSLVGMMYLMGWEVGIGKATLAGFFQSDGSLTAEESIAAAAWLASGIVLGSLLYTVLGGLRGNAAADIFMNLCKTLIVLVIFGFVLVRFVSQTQTSFSEAFFPSLDTLQKNLGWWGLITNIAFNLAWQFVDTSSWQSFIAGSQKNESETASNLKWSGLVVFIVPGIAGTLLGASLVGVSNITPDNLLSIVVSLVPSYSGITLFVSFCLIVACVMSMIDGLFLASAFTLIVDVFHSQDSLSALDSDPRKAERLLLLVRISLIAIAFAAIWGVQTLLELLNLNLFQFVYVVIITQLALLGPVVVGLASERVSRLPLWLSILTALVIGFGSVALGTKCGQQWMVDGAGAFTIAGSILVAFAVTRPKSLKNATEVNHVQ